MNLTPRNYRPMGSILDGDYAVILQEHPEAFDCIIYPAKASEYNEILADNALVGTLLDRDERAQEYEPPILRRAMLVPAQELDFDATDSGSYEGFTASTDALRLLLSEPDLRRHSIVQWLEYLDVEGTETVERTVYVQDIQPMGRTLTAGMVYICYPLPAMGEVPEEEHTEAVQDETITTDVADTESVDTSNDDESAVGVL